MRSSVLDLCNDNALVIERKKKKKIWETVSLHVAYFFPLELKKKKSIDTFGLKNSLLHMFYICGFITQIMCLN